MGCCFVQILISFISFVQWRLIHSVHGLLLVFWVRPARAWAMILYLIRWVYLDAFWFQYLMQISATVHWFNWLAVMMKFFLFLVLFKDLSFSCQMRVSLLANWTFLNIRGFWGTLANWGINLVFSTFLALRWWRRFQLCSTHFVCPFWHAISQIKQILLYVFQNFDFLHFFSFVWGVTFDFANFLGL